MENARQRNRREFIAGTLALPVVTGLTPAPEARSRIVIAHDPAPLLSLSARPDAARLYRLVNQGMQSLTGADSGRKAWQQFVRPSDVVGLKVNCLAGKGLSTSVQLTEAVVQCLEESGVPPERIIIWDRHSDDLESAGFRVVTGGRRPRCYGNDVGGYETDLAVWGSVGSLLSSTLVRACSVVINLPLLKDHGIAGVSIALKNLFGAIHNPNKYHPNVCNPYVADVFMLPPVRSRVRLNICEAIVAQYEGGPPYMPQWCWPMNSLILGGDPVALDSVGWQLIEEKRKEKGFKPLAGVGRHPTYIATAADKAHRLGTNDPARIEVVRVEL
ncbi:MAG: DUF362 domain-containing protein [Acidobacteria bacterium]|nr:MAG: DUF362 domain-containing protein [Acidobacteriota bacterium]